MTDIEFRDNVIMPILRRVYHKGIIQGLVGGLLAGAAIGVWFLK